MSERRRTAIAVVMAAALIAICAAPVLLAPRERLFGDELVGRHHDPFTAMERFARFAVDGFTQPMTDGPGAILARVIGPVAAFNVLILISFPLSAGAAFALARYLGVGARGALLAALAYAFSPFHVAQAAYHVHIAQTQWLPLYLLALLRWIDGRGGGAVVAAAAAGVVLSNFYSGLIAAAITPAAIAARVHVQGGLGLRRTLWLAAVVVVLGASLVVVRSHYTAYAMPRADVARFAANWYDYLAPPADNPFVPPRRIVSVEQQVSVGLSLLVLAGVGVWDWRVRQRRGEPAPTATVLAIGLTGFVLSLPPDVAFAGLRFAGPSAWVHAALPVFRSFARFGVVVQLMAAIAAGAGFERLRAHRAAAMRAVAAVLVAACAIEYSHWPWTRDVLPTQADRSMMRLAGAGRAVECGAADPASISVAWLSGGRITPADPATLDCAEPEAAAKLASLGFTHAIVPRGTWERLWLSARRADDWRLVGHFRDGDLLAIAAVPAAVFTRRLTGFWPREHNEGRTWRWAAAWSTWSIARTTPAPSRAVLDVELAAAGSARVFDVLIDGRPLTTLTVLPERRTFRIGPVPLAGAESELVFRARDGSRGATDVDAGDRRALAIAVGQWRWAETAGPP